MAVTVKINAGALNRFFERPVKPYLLKKAREVAEEAKRNTPTSTGELRTSIRVESEGSKVFVKVTAPHAGFVHEGTGPQHQPSPRANYYPKLRRRGLILWSESKQLNPYQVAHGIQANGTPANPFLTDALEKVLGRYQFKWIRREVS